jgi:hypothetical protein
MQLWFRLMVVCVLSAALLAACGLRRGGRNSEDASGSTPAVIQSDPQWDEIEQSLQQLEDDVNNIDTLDDLDDL